MFLRTLNNEQKELFLNLALSGASANNKIEENETFLLNAYADEMNIDVKNASTVPLKEICKKLLEISNYKELNQISFEIIGMMISDNEYDEYEKAFILDMAEIFEIPEEKIEIMLKYAIEYSKLIKKINLLMYE